MSTLQNVQNGLGVPNPGDADAARLESGVKTKNMAHSDHAHEKTSLSGWDIPWPANTAQAPHPQTDPAAPTRQKAAHVAKDTHTITQDTGAHAQTTPQNANGSPEKLVTAFLEDHQRLLQRWMHQKSKGQSYLDDPTARHLYFQHSQRDGRIAEYHALRYMLGENTEAHTDYAALIESDYERVRHKWAEQPSERIASAAHDPKFLKELRKASLEVGNYLGRYLTMQRVLDHTAAVKPTHDQPIVETAPVTDRQATMATPQHQATQPAIADHAHSPEDLTTAFLEDHQRLVRLWTATKSKGENYLDHPEASKIYFTHAHRDGRIAEYYALKHLMSAHESGRPNYAALLEADIQKVRNAWHRQHPNGAGSFTQDPALVKSYRAALATVGSYIATYQTMRLALTRLEAHQISAPE